MKTLPQNASVLRFFSALLLAAFAVAGVGAPARAEAVVSFEQRTIELNGLEVGVYCGDAGWGELVRLSGSVNVLFYTIENANGGFLYRSKINGMGVTGVGRESGATYHVTMISAGTGVLNPSGRSNSTNLTVANLIGQGVNNKAILNSVFRVGVDDNGEERILVDHYTVACH